MLFIFMYQNKPNRLKVWDYDSSGYYFITINIRNRIPLFSKIISNKIILSTLGEIAYRCWIKIPEHNKNISLDEFIIMPDHIHGIIKINPFYSKIPQKPQYKKLPIIIGSYKSAVSKIAHRDAFIDFSWQRSYYDHIVRDKNELNRIRRYIINNPRKYLITQ